MTTSRTATWLAFRSVVRRSLTIDALHRSVLVQAPRHRCQTLTSSTALARRIHRNHFTSNRQLKQEHPRQDESSHESVKRKATTRKTTTTHSLRKVAVEAQRSRSGLIKGSGKLKQVNPDATTKQVTAYCAAETYDVSLARAHLERRGFTTDPFRTSLFPQVLHVQTQEEAVPGVGDIFVFPSGCVVTWNVSEGQANRCVESWLVGAAGEASHLDRKEIEDLEYVEDPDKEVSRIVGDTIILGTKASTDSDAREPADKDAPRSSEADTVLAKIAFSSALARSTKLAVLENALNAYFATTRSIPMTLSSGRPLRITRSQILKKTGELLSIRAQLNLYSELTDSLPDLFWDSPHELGLEGYYEMVGRALDVGVRIKVLNEKMDYASEIAAVLRERLSEKHSYMLEWMIIGLICIEVGFGVIHLIRETGEVHENQRTRELVETWLQREIQRS